MDIPQQGRSVCSHFYGLVKGNNGILPLGHLNYKGMKGITSVRGEEAKDKRSSWDSNKEAKAMSKLLGREMRKIK